MKKLSKDQSLGLFFIMVSVVASQFHFLPNFLQGLLLALGLVFLLNHLLSSSSMMTKLRTFKRNLFKKSLGKQQ